MNLLSVGADIAWKFAAREAAAAKFQFIEKEHMFNGIFSLGKVISLGQEGSGLIPQDFTALQKEHDSLQMLMKKLNLDMTQLRRRMRKMLGVGDYKRTEKVIHRSDSCKKMFARASDLSSSSETLSVFHILVAIMEQPGDHILQTLDLDAKNAIFIMTSNLYRKEENQKKIGFIEEKNERVKEEKNTEVKHFFRPEFLNRIDEQIVFKQLDREDIESILEGLVRELFQDIKTRYAATIQITEGTKDFIIDKGYDPRYGVRDLRRTVEKFIQIPLSNLILNNKITAENAWEIICKDNSILIVPMNM